MPTITLKKRDLLKLLDKRLSNGDLKEILNKIKPEVEEITSKQVIYELNPDRPDLFSSPGLARAINGFLGLETGFPRYETDDADITVKVEHVKARPYIACAIVEHVKLTAAIVEELMNFQEVLHKTLGRNRRKVAIGLHNFRDIHPPIRYVPSSPTEEMVPLEMSKKMSLQKILAEHPKGKKFSHLIEDNGKYPTIIDQAGIFSFPPIINSKRTKLTRNTSHIFIDVTGQDLSAISDTMNVLITSLAERGGKIREVKLEYPEQIMIFPKFKKKEKLLDVDYINKLIGVDFSPKEVTKLLEKMRYGTEVNEERKVKVTIPPFRPDILHPVDIIEDICIGYDFDELSPEPPGTASVGGSHPIETFSSEVRNTMSGLGFQEVMNPTLMSKEILTEKMLLEEEKIKVAELCNPVSEEYEILRNQLLPSLLHFLSKNTHRSFPQKIFELENVVIIDEDIDNKTKNVKKLSAVISDHEVGYSDVRANLDALLQQFGLDYNIRSTTHPSFIAGRVGEIIFKNKEKEKKLGLLGEIHPQILANFKIEKPTVGLEINIDKMFHFFLS